MSEGVLRAPRGVCAELCCCIVAADRAQSVGRLVGLARLRGEDDRETRSATLYRSRAADESRRAEDDDREVEREADDGDVRDDIAERERDGRRGGSTATEQSSSRHCTRQSAVSDRLSCLSQAVGCRFPVRHIVIWKYRSTRADGQNAREANHRLSAVSAGMRKDRHADTVWRCCVVRPRQRAAADCS